jgi:ectoine hydroxylase-related dioxygenase (phytanoyl-CoA dioxygenase family)
VWCRRYWPLRPAGAAIAVSIALADADHSNGCFRVIPKSHHWGLKYWGNITRGPGEDIHAPQAPTSEATRRLAGIDAGGVDSGSVLNAPSADMLAQQIEVPLRAGSALFFHSLTAHGSDANLSDRSRNTALYAAFSAKAEFIGGQPQSYRVLSGMGGMDVFTMEPGQQEARL